MTYTHITQFLSEVTIPQAIAMLFAGIICTCIVYCIIHTIITGIAESVKGTEQNKDLIDNMKRLDTKTNINQKLTK